MVEDVPTRVLAKKAFMPTKCSTGKNDIVSMRKLAPHIDVNGKELPGSLKGGQLCTYIELLAREEHNIAWYTPEELKVLDNKKKAVMDGLSK